jgi:hypothetical protein
MATKTHVVIFKEAMEKYAQPELYICAANEADAIEELLETVGNEGCGPIETLSYTEFVEEIKTISLADLRERFADELAELEEDEEDDNECSGSVVPEPQLF